MQAYTELIPPTAVTDAVSLPFLSSQSQNLIVAKTSLLQIFELKPSNRSTQHQTHGHGSSSASYASSKLVLVGEYTLSGIITSLARVKVINTKSGGEALLVSFKNAKVSLVEWNPEWCTLSTISVHYYEGDDLQGAPWVADLGHHESYLTADPSSRCAALKFGVRQLAILPFRQAGDDLAISDYDPDLDGPPAERERRRSSHEKTEHRTPYSSSFTLSLTALDSSVIHVVDLAFLYEYREPTLGVLSAAKNPSVSLTEYRKDVLAYTAFTLDLEQQARTPLLSVSGLPSDLFQMLPLALPIGGSLLIGGNEIVHVDQGGKTHAVAVNEFAKKCSSFPMTDQSELQLKLEYCVAAQLSTSKGDVLLVLGTGQLCFLRFKIEGRSVSGLVVEPVPIDRGGNPLNACASSIVKFGQDCVFLGSEDADSVLLRFGQRRPQLSRKRSHAEMLGIEDAESDEEMDDADDLYGDGSSDAKVNGTGPISNVADNVVFSIEDRLINLTTTAEPAFGQRKCRRLDTEHSKHRNDLQMVLSTGTGRAGTLSFLSKHIHVHQIRQLPLKDVSRLWCFTASGRASTDDASGSHQPGYRSNSSESKHNNFIIASIFDSDRGQTSQIYDISELGLQKKEGTDFEEDTITLDVDVICQGSRIVQITRAEVRSYEPDFGFPQIVPMIDEETEAELKITHSSFADPYVMVIRDDLSVIILKADEKGEVEELDRSDTLLQGKWTCGCLYQRDDDTVACLVNQDGSLQMFRLPRLESPFSTSRGLDYLPPLLATEFPPRRTPNRQQIEEVLLTDLGDKNSKSPHLVVRNSNHEVAIYQPFNQGANTLGDFESRGIRWIKLADESASLAYNRESDSNSQYQIHLKAVPHLGGYSAVIVSGNRPRAILKDASSTARIIDFGDENLQHVSSAHLSDCNNGCILIDSSKTAVVAGLPSNTRFGDVGWGVSRYHQGAKAQSLCYHPPTGLYAIGTNEPAQFQLPEDDDWHQEWAKEEIDFKPEGNVSRVKVIDPTSWKVISEFTLESYEWIVSVKCINLEISEVSHERKQLITVSTAVLKGEDLSANGAIYVFDIIPVVPEPDKPETSQSLKLLVREDVKGAVTGLSEIGDEGFLIATQGQKCMVRGLKEDNTLLPVAFLDIQTQVNVLKSVKGTGMALVGDTLKGLWLIGFMTEPYRMRLFGKSKAAMDVVAAEFLPQSRQLFVLAADVDCVMHVFEFNPEDPKSLSGQRLLNKSTFHMGHSPTAMTLLPLATVKQQYDKNGDVNMENVGDADTSHCVAVSSHSGALSLVTPIDEQRYRRLGALQNHLTNISDHPCGLNPRAYRAIESEGFAGRGILDGQILKRWNLLSTQRKVEAGSRVGADMWEIQDDLQTISGRGLGYF